MDYQTPAPYATAVEFTREPVRRSYKNDNRKARRDTRAQVRLFKSTAKSLFEMGNAGVTDLTVAALIPLSEREQHNFEGLCSVFNYILTGDPFDSKHGLGGDNFDTVPGYILMQKFLTREAYVEGLGRHNYMTSARMGILKVIVNTPVEMIVAEVRTPTTRFGALAPL